MALCRKCRVREASDIWYDGLCSYCYYEREKNRKKEEQRDREQREAQERERERDRENRREEQRHRERLEELREKEVKYQRQAARDAEIAREEAEEARRIAGLTTFTCCHCQGTFNEERGYSAIESPIGKPVCNKCYDLLKKCTECNQYFWKNDPRSTPIRPLEKEYYKSGSIIKVKDRNDYICDNCVSTAKYESFFAEQKKLKQEYDTQERIRREKEAAERAERERKEAEAAEQARIKAEREKEAYEAERREREEEEHQKAVLFNVIFGIIFTLLSAYVCYSLMSNVGLILGIILGIGVTTIRLIQLSQNFGDFLVRVAVCIVGSAVVCWLFGLFYGFACWLFGFTDISGTTLSIIWLILTLVSVFLLNS
jgi:hypothetical protein